MSDDEECTASSAVLVGLIARIAVQRTGGTGMTRPIYDSDISPDMIFYELRPHTSTESNRERTVLTISERMTDRFKGQQDSSAFKNSSCI